MNCEFLSPRSAALSEGLSAPFRNVHHGLPSQVAGLGKRDCAAVMYPWAREEIQPVCCGCDARSCPPDSHSADRPEKEANLSSSWNSGCYEIFLVAGDPSAYRRARQALAR